MLTLVEQSKYLTNPLQRGVIQVYARSTPVLEKLPFVQVNGNAYQYNVEDALPSVGFRAVNTPYVESHGTIQRKTENMKIFGGTTKIDRFLVASQGNINDIRSVQTEMTATAAALLFTKSFFKGDSSINANEFDGLEKRLAGNQVLDGSAATAIGDLTGAVDKLIDQVVGGPDMLFMSADIRLFIDTDHKSLVIAGQVQTDNISGFRHKLGVGADAPGSLSCKTDSLFTQQPPNGMF